MVRRFFLSVFILLFSSVAYAPRATANDRAHEVFQRGVRQLRELVTHCHRAQAKIVEECSPKIRRLLEAGRYEEARKLAARCIAQIDKTTGRCNDAINHLCRTTVNRLRELEAPRLARKFKDLCEVAKRKIHQSGDRAKAAIRKLFE